MEIDFLAIHQQSHEPMATIHCNKDWPLGVRVTAGEPVILDKLGLARVI